MAEENSQQELENPDPQWVVDVFVKKYYAVLENSPELVHRFYKDHSVISRLGPDGGMESVTTMQSISDTIMSSDYKGVSAEILNADFQESIMGGIIVSVNGYLRRKSFYQTFFLARQEIGFYVLNDILRITDDAPPHEELAPSESSLSVHLTPAPEIAGVPEPTDASVVEDDVKRVVSEAKDDIKKHDALLENSPQEPQIPASQRAVNAFVEYYYKVLENSPELVHRFYKDHSVISRPGPDGGMESVTTMQSISDTIMSSDYKGVSAEILNADFQESIVAGPDGGGTIVAVNGYLMISNHDTTLRRKRFYQTFFLARQEKGFFVSNDIMRFTDAAPPREELTRR